MQPESQGQVENVRNPMSRAEKQKQFTTAGQVKEIFTNPQELYQAAKKYSKTFKTVKTEHPRIKSLQIIDISLNARGPTEDQIYTKYAFYRNNIRRGNTLIYDNKTKQAFWGRKGLNKFFDISMNSIESILEENAKKLNEEKQMIHYIVFSQIENLLSCNDEIGDDGKASVDVYKLNKANGENAQISYFPKTQQWIIASKNVSVLVRDKNDLKFYQGDRFQFAKLIAQTWFNIIADKQKQDIQNLKADLTNKTIIGQYCGNPDYQHLVKYDKTTIFFYAAVLNNSKDSCLPPNQAFALLERNKIPIVKNHQRAHAGQYKDYVELGKGLLRNFRDVATASIFEEEEGSVVYFVINQTKEFCQFISDRYLQGTVSIPNNWENQIIKPRVTSLGKMKTLEYRILRKLRQKLKYFTRLKQGGNPKNDKKEDEYKKFQQKYGSFEKEVFQLLKGQKLNKPIEYYFCIALISFDYVFKNRKSPKALQLLNQHFLDFLSVIFWCVQNKKEVTQNHMNDYKLVQQLRQTNWEKYGIDVIKEYENMLQKIVPRYWKIKQSIQVEQNEEKREEQENDDEG